MTTCYLPVGWRGTGKSTWTLAVKNELGVPVLSRDRIRKRLNNGKLYFCPYTYNPEWELELMLRFLQKKIKSDVKEITFDCFTGWRQERIKLVERLRSNGVSTVICVRVTTPAHIAYEQYRKREEGRGSDSYIPSFETYSRDFDIMEQQTEDIETEGFDKIVYVDPTQMRLPFL